MGPFSGLHRECWTDRGCRADGASICNWCAAHSGSAMYCCRKSWSDRYTEGHNCHGASFSEEDQDHHVCVLPSTDNSTGTTTSTILTTTSTTTSTTTAMPTPMPTPFPTPLPTPVPTSAPTP